MRRVAAVDLDLDRREIKVRGEGLQGPGRQDRYEAARRVDRYLRVGTRHEQAHVPGSCLTGPARTMAGVRQLGWGLRAGWS